MANPWRFGGSYGVYTDAATGLVKIGQRYYDPGVGRWTQPDPKAMPFDSAQANHYRYAGCNPVNYTDPTGLDHCGTKEWLKAGIGTAGGAAGVVAGTGSIPVSGPPIWVRDPRCRCHCRKLYLPQRPSPLSGLCHTLTR